MSLLEYTQAMSRCCQYTLNTFHVISKALRELSIQVFVHFFANLINWLLYYKLFFCSLANVCMTGWCLLPWHKVADNHLTIMTYYYWSVLANWIIFRYKVSLLSAQTHTHAGVLISILIFPSISFHVRDESAELH